VLVSFHSARRLFAGSRQLYARRTVRSGTMLDSLICFYVLTPWRQRVEYDTWLTLSESKIHRLGTSYADSSLE
jgi:hypothetical protein